MKQDEILICTRHDEVVPLIWTYAFRGSELWCPACGFDGSMFGSGRTVELTEGLKKAEKEWKKKAEKFLSAKSTLACHSLKYKGKIIERKDLPQKEIDRCKKIVSDWKYTID